MKTRNGIFFILLILVVIFLSKIKYCNDNTDYQNDTIKVTDTVIVVDTMYSLETLVINRPIVIYEYVPANVDTQKILKEYFAHYIYIDTLRNDTGLFLRLEEEITKNNVISRILEIKDYERTKIITNTEKIYINEVKNRFYGGLFSSYNFNSKIQTVGILGTFMDKKYRVYGVGLGHPSTIFFSFQYHIF